MKIDFASFSSSTAYKCHSTDGPRLEWITLRTKYEVFF